MISAPQHFKYKATLIVQYLLLESNRHVADLLVSVLEDGSQPRQQLRDRRLHLAHTDHIHDRLETYQRYTPRQTHVLEKIKRPTRPGGYKHVMVERFNTEEKRRQSKQQQNKTSSSLGQ